MRIFISLLITVLFGQLFAVKDMLGGSVVKQKNIDSIVVLGAVPVISSFVFALNKGPTIKNALPSMFARKNMTNELYYAMATNASKTNSFTLTDSTSGVNIETLLQDKPQLVLTMDALSAKNLRDKGVNTACLVWRNDDDLKKLMLFLGDMLGAQKQAIAYNEYADKTIAFVKSRVSKIPVESKQKVLYFDYKSMSNPHLIADWWINKSGGISVTDVNRKVEKHTFSLEQMLAWNPDVIVVANPNDIADIYKNKAMSNIAAVKNKRIFVSPSGVHLWANRTSEQPLMLLWAAKQFYPKYFQDLDIQKETKNFYSTFFKYELSSSELNNILTPAR